MKFIFCLSCILLLNGCAQQKQEKVTQDSFAIISLTEVIKEHHLYKEYQGVQDKLVQLQNLQKMQKEMSRKQLSGLDKFYVQTQLNQGKFNETLFQTKLLEKQVSLEKQLDKKRKDLQLKGKEELLAKRAELEEKYKLEFFNLRTQQQLLLNAPTKFRSEQELAAQKETQKKLQAEQLALKQKIEQELLELINAQKQETEQAMQPYYQQAQQELANYAQALREQIKLESQKNLQGLEQNMQKLPSQVEDTLLSVQAEIDNLQSRKDYLYREIYQDVENQTAKVALEQGFTVVFKDVRLNIAATDITKQVQVELQKHKKEKGKK